MELIFSCPSCKQQLEAETGMAGSTISCPSCGASIVIPEADPANLRANPSAASAAAKEEKHFAVPVTEGPTSSLIKKAAPPLETAKDHDKRLRIKCIKRTECVEVGKDHFDEVVSDFLNKIGEDNILGHHVLAYTYVDMSTRNILTDYGILIIYKG